MQKIKYLIKRILKKDSFLYKVFSKGYHVVSTLKYQLTNYRKERKRRQELNKRIYEAIERLKVYSKTDYIVFYNPTWLGVANSTKGLFKNIVPLEQVYQKKYQSKIAATVVNCEIKTVIFSQMVEGWIEIIKQIKKLDANIKIKVIWHGNCYEFFSDYTWNLNKDVIKLYQDKKINGFGFVRSTMFELYKKAGFRSYYLQNNVHIDATFKKESEKQNKKTKTTIRIGIYNADTRELKNIYTALSAMRLVPNTIADVVPINKGAKEFAEILGLQTTSLEEYIPTKELLKRIQKNDINIYPTYTENAPMFPLESFEMGVPCLLGNNNDYFIGTKLGEYVILEREDDPIYIKNRIVYCIEHREKIISLYQQWKAKFDINCNKWVQDFITK